MRITIHGAAGEVTGSCHLLEIGRRRVLLDCGMIQGRDEEQRNGADFPFDPRSIDAVVVSHAHIDHIGRLPLLVKRGYDGPIFATRATADLARVMLEDSASLAERDAEHESMRRERRGDPPVAPLYGTRDAIEALRQMKGMDYGESREIVEGLTLRFHDAGHIIGSAIVELVGQVDGAGRRLVFSGDLGPGNAPFLPDPTALEQADLVLLESTYGDRNHRSREDTIVEFGEVLARAKRDGGNVLIPAFAVGRTQELLYWLSRNFDEWKLGNWQVVLDSPMALRVIEVYRRHTALMQDGDAQMLEGGRRPFDLPNLRLVGDSQESMALNRRSRGMIVIAGSGMCNGGRIRHHLKHNLWRPEADVIFVGYQAEGTLGRRLVEGAGFVDLFGDRIKVRAGIHTIGGFSAHAGQDGLLRWYGQFRDRPRVALVHGEEHARDGLARALKAECAVDALRPAPGEVIEV